MISAECDSPNLCDSPFRGEKSEIATYEIARVESILQKLLSLYPELEVEAGLDPLDSIHFAIEQISSIVHEKQSLDSKNELRFIVHEAVQEVASQMRGEMRETILSTPAFQTPSATPAPPTPLPSNINLENQINFLEGQVQNLKSDLDRTESDAKILVQDAQRKLNMSNVQTELIETLLRSSEVKLEKALEIQNEPINEVVQMEIDSILDTSKIVLEQEIIRLKNSVHALSKQTLDERGRYQDILAKFKALESEYEVACRQRDDLSNKDIQVVGNVSDQFESKMNDFNREKDGLSISLREMESKNFELQSIIDDRNSQYFSEYSALEVKWNTLVIERTQLFDELEALKSRHTKVSSDYDQLSLKSLEMSSEIEKLVKERDSTSSDRENIQIQYDQISLERDQMSVTISNNTIELTALKLNLENLSSQQNGFNVEYSDLNSRYNLLLTSFSEKSTDFNNLVIQLAQVTADCGKLKLDLSNASSLHTSNTEFITQKDLEVAGLNNQIQELTAERAEKMVLFESVSNKLQDVESQLKNVSTDRDSAKKSLLESTGKLSETVTLIESLEGNVRTLEQKLRDSEKDIDKLKSTALVSEMFLSEQVAQIKDLTNINLLQTSSLELLKSNVETLSNEIDSVSKERDELSTLSENRAMELAELNTRLEASISEASLIKSGRVLVEKNLEEANALVTKRDESILEFESIVNQKDGDISKIEIKLIETSKKFIEISESFDMYKKESNSSSKALLEKIKTLESNALDFDSYKTESQESIKSLNEKIALYKIQVVDLETAVSGLETKLRSLESISESTNKELSRKNEEHLKQIEIQVEKSNSLNETLQSKTLEWKIKESTRLEAEAKLIRELEISNKKLKDMSALVETKQFDISNFERDLDNHQKIAAELEASKKVTLELRKKISIAESEILKLREFEKLHDSLFKKVSSLEKDLKTANENAAKQKSADPLPRKSAIIPKSTEFSQPTSRTHVGHGLDMTKEATIAKTPTPVVKRKDPDTATDLDFSKRSRTESESKVTRSSSQKSISSTQSKGGSQRISENFSNSEIIIAFSGFKEKTKFDSKFKATLTRAVSKLPKAQVMTSSGDELDSRITHLFTPAASRTIKTLSASLLGKWIIYDDKWITDSEKAGRWLPEAKYGIKSTGSPFKGKKFFLTESFHKENKGTARKDVYMNYINCLLVSIGKGELVDEAGSADYVLKGFLSGEKKPGELDWKGFISMIPQPPLI